MALLNHSKHPCFVSLSLYTHLGFEDQQIVHSRYVNIECNSNITYKDNVKFFFKLSFLRDLFHFRENMKGRFVLYSLMADWQANVSIIN